MRPAVATAALIAFALAACTPAPAPQGEAPAPSAPAAQAPAPATPATAPPAPATSAATPSLAIEPGALARIDGYGDMRLGMTADEARTAWQGELEGDTVEPDNCAYLRPKADEDFRVGFMFESGTFVRYDVAVDSMAAPGGGRVGQTRADIERLYGSRVEVRQHEYVPEGHYLRVTDPAIANGALVFEMDEKGTVTRWRLGRAPQVDYVEGCA